MLISLTGVNGFVGGHAAMRLLSEGHQIMAFGRRPECALGARPGLRYSRWDITTGPIDTDPVDAVVHCAGSVTEWGAQREFDRANVEGTRNVLESFPDARTFVHISTASVYDLITPKLEVSEDTPVSNRFISGYPRSKVAAERLVSARPGNSVILRPHIVYGPGDTKIMPRLVDMLHRGLFVVPGSGSNRLSVTHVDNLSLAIARAVERQKGHEVFNIADAEQATVNELIASVQMALASNAMVLHVPTALIWLAAVGSEWLHRAMLRRRPPLLTRFVVAELAVDFTLDISRAIAELGYRPYRSYREALRELADSSRLVGASRCE